MLISLRTNFYIKSAMALVDFLPRPESQGIILASCNKKSWFPEMALVDLGPMNITKNYILHYSDDVRIT